MLVVPLNPVPAQTAAIVLGGQNCALSIYDRGGKLYIDLDSNGTQLLRSMICRNITRLLLDRQYLGFVGDFAFVDTLVSNPDDGADPAWEGLGSQFQLIYFEAGDL